MKIYGILCVIVAIILLFTPLAAVTYDTDNEESETDIVETADNTAEKSDSDTISVFLSEEEKTEEIDMRDYIIGSVAQEMPASYEIEALKAQALAAVTYAEYSKKNNSDSTSSADISDDSNTHQGYLTQEQMQEKWGDAYEIYYNKIAAAVDAVIDKVITYDSEPIMAAYHAISTGQTESAENIWGEEIPYLASVESEGDKYSTRYSSEVTLTSDEIIQAAKEKGLTITDTDDELIKINSTTQSGTVTSVSIGSYEFTGTDIRDMFSLRSPSFDVTYENGSYTFSVKGYGHSVGMSQYGADWYAKQGYTYEQIIKHYYTGVEIENR